MAVVRIGIIEDTLLHGGTQMWSVEAARFFCDRGAGVTVISPEGRWVAARSREAGLDVASYDYDSVSLGDKNAVDAWSTGGGSLIHQGIDLSRFETNAEVRHAAREENPIPSEAPPILGCIGSFEERKGQIVLLRALARIRAALPKTH